MVTKDVDQVATVQNEWAAISHPVMELIPDPDTSSYRVLVLSQEDKRLLDLIPTTYN